MSLRRNRLIQTALSFGGIQAAQIALPLLALPYLARVLGPDAFGVLMYMLTFSTIFCALQEWGFTLGAARAAAETREEAQSLGELLDKVLSGKLILAGGAICIAAIAFPFLAHVRENPVLYCLAVGHGLAWGMNPTWFFQGTGDGMRRMALFDVAGNLLALVMMLALVRTPADGFVYLGLLLVCRGSAYAIQTRRAYGTCGKGPSLSPRKGFAALREFSSLFLTRLASMFHVQASLLLVGQILAPSLFGLLVIADKIARAVVGLSDPVTRTVFPEVCALRDTKPETAYRMLRISFFGTLGAMVCAGAALYVLAPLVLRFFLGAGYSEAVTPLRILCLLIPILACNMVAATQTLVAFRLERCVTGVLVVAGCASLPLAYLLTTSFGIVGAAWLPVLLESLIALLFGICLHRALPKLLW